MNKRNISWCLFSLFSAMAISMQIPYPKVEIDKSLGFVYEIFLNLQYSMSGKAALMTFCFLSIFIMRIKIEKKLPKRKWIVSVVSFSIALLWLMAAYFRVDVRLSQVYLSMGQIVKATIYVIGMTNFLTLLFYGFEWVLDYSALQDVVDQGGYLHGKINNHPFISRFLLFLVIWLPHIVICYPGYMPYDSWSQLSQAWGLKTFTAHHPPVITLMIGLCSRVGVYFFGSGNIGLYLYVLLQYFSMAAISAYGFTILEKMHTPAWLTKVFFCICVASPYYTQYLGTVLKDMMYSYAVLLLVLEVICQLIERDSFFKKKRHVALFSIAVMGTYLFRNNGRYVLLPTIMILILLQLYDYKTKKLRLKSFIKNLSVLVIPVIFSILFYVGILNFFQIEKGPLREALSFPFQQTARYVSAHYAEIPEEEAEIISKVLNYEKLPTLYDPRISDPVKGTYNRDATIYDLMAYFKVWLKQGVKDPITYIAATVNQSYYIISPFDEITEIIGATIQSKSTMEKVGDLVREKINIHEIEWLSSGKKIIKQINRTLFSFPVIGLLTHVAFYNLILLALLCFILDRKMWKVLIAAAPIWFSVIIVILAPTIQNHPRYAFPIVFTVPYLVAYFCYENRPKGYKKDS